MLIRAISGAVFVALLVTCILFSFRSLSLLFLVITGIALYEFYSIRKVIYPELKFAPIFFVGIISYSVIAITGLKILPGSDLIPVFLFFLIIVLAFITGAVFDLIDKQQKGFTHTSHLIFSCIYIGIGFGILNLYAVNGVHYNGWPVLNVFIMVWANDTFAYITGKFFGKNKLWERISPKKTWEGFFGGIIFTLIASILINKYEDLHYSNLEIAGIAIIVSVFATFGDLFESLLKRQSGIKDSGNIIPGHGGVLDRFDGALFAFLGLSFFYSINFGIYALKLLFHQ